MMPRFVVDFGTIGCEPAPDGRLDAPAFHRNHDPIWAVLSPILARERGDALEVGSGTGQHVVEFARKTPDIVWWSSDVNEGHLRSIEAWRIHAGLANLRPPARIDLGDPNWPSGQRADLCALVCINVLHIAPWTVAQGLFAGAGRLLRPGGHLFVYGALMRDGAHTAPSNAEFDASLRAKDERWGVRDIADLRELGKTNGLRLVGVADMPANNFTLTFVRK